jgi:acyl-coenzyme A thioesterase PaaI-like protein
VPEHLCGAGTVAHGGIQATLLDEAMGFATRTAVGDDQIIVTADFSLRYRRPVPIGEELRIRGELDRREGDHIFLRGVIVDADGQELTTAEARWKHLGPAPAPSGPTLEKK